MASSEKIAEIIAAMKGLDEPLKEIAARYIPIFAEMAVEDINVFVEKLMSGNWQEPYKHLIKRMTTEELGLEMDRINLKLRDLNRQNARLVDAQKEMVREALHISLLVLKAAVVS